jgi:hypothetical protein
MKALDPVLACLAGYLLIRQGQPARYVGAPDPQAGPDKFEPSAMRNMLKFFGNIPDSHILAGLVEPERQKEHFANAVARGLPLFLEGFIALQSYYEGKLPGMLGILAHTLLSGSPWTAWTAREPILSVQQGRFESPPAQWRVLEEKRAMIESALPSVGALEVEGVRREFGGTAFLFAGNLLMTSSNSAATFTEELPSGWRLRGSLSVYFNPGEDPSKSSDSRIPVTGVQVFEKEKLAVLTLDRTLNVAPLQLTEEETILELFDKVYLIGYPAFDSRSDPDAATRALGGVYQIKRVQPGIVLEVPGPYTTFDHSCFTLRGNGGSPVISLKTGKVVGVHWGGWRKSYGRGRATALSKVRSLLG